ncbi:ribonuclease T2 family protein [Roseobacteraceae bacterium S113]
MRGLMIVLLALWGGLAHAEGEPSGEFDYYVLALSWSPNWCAREGDARGAPECKAGAGRGWSLHGLWPQNERGWPSYCRTTQRAPSRSMTGAMADIMGSSGLAWHQWRKHGVCSGDSADAYFDASRFAYDSITRPEVFRRLDSAVKLPASVVEEAFLVANPKLERDMITITCRDGHIQEARICLTKGLVPRTCGADVIRDCRATDALFTPVR